ncbi:MAG: hypothetical protein RL748_33 [Pseudomonadota bacterium]|jgi:hypothetical protein
MSLLNLIGTLGALAVILAYGLLQFGRWQADDVIYSITNAIGAALILVSLVVEPNLPSIVMESFWLLISLIGLWRAIRSPKKIPK